MKCSIKNDYEYFQAKSIDKDEAASDDEDDIPEEIQEVDDDLPDVDTGDADGTAKAEAVSAEEPEDKTEKVAANGSEEEVKCVGPETEVTPESDTVKQQTTGSETAEPTPEPLETCDSKAPSAVPDSEAKTGNPEDDSIENSNKVDSVQPEKPAEVETEEATSSPPSPVKGLADKLETVDLAADTESSAAAQSPAAAKGSPTTAGGAASFEEVDMDDEEDDNAQEPDEKDEDKRNGIEDDKDKDEPADEKDEEGAKPGATGIHVISLNSSPAKFVNGKKVNTTFSLSLSTYLSNLIHPSIHPSIYVGIYLSPFLLHLINYTSSKFYPVQYKTNSDSITIIIYSIFIHVGIYLIFSSIHPDHLFIFWYTQVIEVTKDFLESSSEAESDANITRESIDPGTSTYIAGLMDR